MITRRVASAASIVAVLAAACHGGGAGGGVVTAPSVPSSQPPTVSLGGQMPEAFNGSETHNEGSGEFNLTLSQSGSQVTGTVAAFGHAGPFAGTVSGNTLTFNFSVGNGGDGCGNSVTGSAAVGPTTIDGTFSGKDCSGKSVTNGKFSSSIPSGNRTQAFPIAGTWVGGGTLHPSYGGGSWTWVLTESPGGTVNGTSFTGKIVLAGNSLKFTDGTVSGTTQNVFPGPQTTVTFTATLSGNCPITIQTSHANITPQPNGRILFNTSGVTSTNCSGPITNADVAFVWVSDSTTPPAPAAVSLAGTWSGQMNDAVRPGTLQDAQLSQVGNLVAGGMTFVVQANGNMHGSNMQASLAGTTLTYTLNIGPGSGCPETVSGTAQVSNTSIDGSYSGTSCLGAINNGHLTMSR